MTGLERGALVLAPAPSGRYRGANRPTFDAVVRGTPAAIALAREYTTAIVLGSGLLEDLEEAAMFRARAIGMGIRGLEVVVIEPVLVPPTPGSLSVALIPPDESLGLLGHDTIEPLEPYWSPLSDPGAARTWTLNEHSLFQLNTEAHTFASRFNLDHTDDPLCVVRIWTLDSTHR